MVLERGGFDGSIFIRLDFRGPDILVLAFGVTFIAHCMHFCFSRIEEYYITPNRLLT